MANGTSANASLLAEHAIALSGATKASANGIYLVEARDADGRAVYAPAAASTWPSYAYDCARWDYPAWWRKQRTRGIVTQHPGFWQLRTLPAVPGQLAGQPPQHCGALDYTRASAERAAMLVRDFKDQLRAEQDGEAGAAAAGQ